MTKPNQLLFSNSWFENARPTWDILFPRLKPRKMLEIGSFEGQATCYAIQSNYPTEITCIDTWEGGLEHSGVDMKNVEKMFDHNVAISLQTMQTPINIVKRKGQSDIELARLLTAGRSNYYDFIYIDGSHQAPDVLTDAILAFKLCKPGGVIAFDDYCWSEDLPYGVDPIRCPKVAIDAFTNIFCRQVKIITNIPMYQLYVTKQ